jgi:hypothetical protein
VLRVDKERGESIKKGEEGEREGERMRGGEGERVVGEGRGEEGKMRVRRKNKSERIER